MLPGEHAEDDAPGSPISWVCFSCGEKNAVANGSEPRQAAAAPTGQAGEGRSDPAGVHETILINEQTTEVESKLETSIPAG